MNKASKKKNIDRIEITEEKINSFGGEDVVKNKVAPK